MKNETIEVLAKRSSCPAFTDKVPKKDILETIAKAGLQSPSAMNAQPWRVVVVTNKELLNEIEGETVKMISQIPAFKPMHDALVASDKKVFYNAPCMIVIPYDPSDSYGQIDCGIVGQSIAVAAEALGVANRIIAINSLAFTGNKSDQLKEKLHFPNGYEFGLAVLLGYAAEEKAPHDPDPEKAIYLD